MSFRDYFSFTLGHSQQRLQLLYFVIDPLVSIIDVLVHVSAYHLTSFLLWRCVFLGYSPGIQYKFWVESITHHILPWFLVFGWIVRIVWFRSVTLRTHRPITWIQWLLAIITFQITLNWPAHTPLRCVQSVGIYSSWHSSITSDPIHTTVTLRSPLCSIGWVKSIVGSRLWLILLAITTTSNRAFRFVTNHWWWPTKWSIPSYTWTPSSSTSSSRLVSSLAVLIG